MSFEEDPEVVADLQLRAASTFDRSRSACEPTWKPPVFVDKWPCRVPECKKPVPVDEDAVDRYQQFNRMLAARGEERLDFRQIVYCDSCRAEFLRTAADRRRAQVDRMRPVIQQLKSSKNPEHERACIKQLEAWGHPDVEGLVQAVRTKLDGKGPKKTNRGEL